MPSDGNYIDGAAASLKAIETWLARHPGAIDSITLVDAHDDYFNLFINDVKSETTIHMTKESIYNACNGIMPFTIHPTVHPNITFAGGNLFSEECREDVKVRFNISNGFADRILKDNRFSENEKLLFSIGVFYMNLIPQAIAKITGSTSDMHDFQKCAGWPEISCGLGGLMHSDVVLRDSGLFPEDKQLPQWVSAVKGELEFFKAFTRDVIGGDIWREGGAATKRLAKSIGQRTDTIANEIDSLVSNNLLFLREGKPLPTHIILGNEVSTSR